MRFLKQRGRHRVANLLLKVAVLGLFLEQPLHPREREAHPGSDLLVGEVVPLVQLHRAAVALGAGDAHAERVSRQRLQPSVLRDPFALTFAPLRACRAWRPC